MLRNEFVVSDVSALREVIPAGLSGSCVADATKVIGHLDEQMVGFVRRSPFVQPRMRRPFRASGVAC